MNPFDILPRSLPRPVDAQGLKEMGGASDGTESSALPADAESFVALLQDLSERSPGNGKGAPLEVDTEILPSNTLSSGNPGSDIANAVSVLLQGILPSGPKPSANPGSEGGAQDQRGFWKPDLESMSLSKDPLMPSSTLPGQRLLVSVQHQETHFRPVLEMPDAALEEATGSEGVTQPQMLSDAPEITKPQSLPEAQRPLPGHSQMQLASEPIAEEQPLVTESFKGDGVEHEGEKGEVLKAAISSNTRNDASPLPPATLHRLATAVAAELQDLARTSAPHPLQSGPKTATISIKASESVLRVLKLQLHPAELGVVTVKMKLAGDGLEMELHTEREETAQLLRHDTEKLSSLLRGAGYKPETINIQVIDTGSQDRGSLQRGQSDFQMQGQSSHQGGGSQGDRYRNRDNQSDISSAEQHKVSDEKGSSPGRHSGSVYL